MAQVAVVACAQPWVPNITARAPVAVGRTNVRNDNSSGAVTVVGRSQNAIAAKNLDQVFTFWHYAVHARWWVLIFHIFHL